MVRNILAKATENKYNVIIESTFKSLDSPLDYLKTLKAAGYKTTVNVIAVDKELAWQSTIERQAEMLNMGLPARSVDRTYFDQTAANLAGNVESVYKTGLVDKLEVRNRTTRLFDSRFNDISHTPFIYSINCNLSYSSLYTLYLAAKLWASDNISSNLILK